MSGAALGIGAALSAYGSYQSGVEREQAYLADAAGKRAQAAQVEISANTQRDILNRQYERTKGATEVAYGASGVSASTGSPLIQMEQMAANHMDELTSLSNAANYRKTSLLTESGYNEVLADQAYRGGVLGAVTGGMSAVTKNPYSYDSGRGNL